MGSLFKTAATSLALVVFVAADGGVGSNCVDERAIGRDSVQWARRFRDLAGTAHEYRRHKRAKHYPSAGSGRPGWALHRPALRTPPFYSHTPPPDYMLDDEEAPAQPAPFVPSGFKLGHFSKKPPTGAETLVDADIANLVRSLSKHDLDRIIEYAGEKNGRPHNQNIIDGSVELDGVEGGRYPARGSLDRPIDFGSPPRPDPPFTREGGSSSGGAYGGAEPDSVTVVDRRPLLFFRDRYREEHPKPSSFTDNSVDFDISYTKNVESVVNPLADYKLENFGELPLMHNESKMKSIDSYNVPHYTVTSISAPPETKKSASGARVAEAAPKFEAAPSAGAKAAARAQSDAHLKAVKIWTHHSVGAAYTVHADGSLSPEKPLSHQPSSYS